MIAYGKSHDYVIDVDERMGYVGKYGIGVLGEAEHNHEKSEAYAAVPNATTNQLIRIAEGWENR